MEDQQQVQNDQQEFHPDLLWEGFIYLAFFTFFCIYLIPNTPKAWSFDRYYPVAMITYGLAGMLTGRVVYVITRKTPWWVKTAIVGVLYAFVIYYLVTHVDRFSIHAA